MTDVDRLAARKRIAKSRTRTERRRQRDVRRLHRRCFWTWPWGHAWEYEGNNMMSLWTCAGCGKRREVEGPW